MEDEGFPGFRVPHPSRKPPEPKTPTRSQRFKCMTEHKGIYSDIICPLKFQTCTSTPKTQPMSQGQSMLKLGHSNTLKGIIKTPLDQLSCGAKDYHVPHVPHNSFSSQTSYFCQGGDKPQVQIAYENRPGLIPRKLAIERRRREYLNLHVEELLAQKGIDSNLLLPNFLENDDEHVTTPDSPVSPFLPLEVFDNEEYDCRAPEDWLALGNADQKPVPGKALLPTSDEIAPDNPSSTPMKYSWHLVGVLDYSKEKCQYLVEKVHHVSRETDENGSSVVNDEHKTSASPGTNSLVAGSKYWVPRIRLQFCAEDPRIFVERIQFALRYRKETEALLLYHLSVDCMPIWKGTPSLSTDSLQSIKRRALSAPRLKLKNLEKCVADLEKEVRLEYDRTMNRLIFDKVVMSYPEEFSHITLPQKASEHVPPKRRVAVPYSAYEKNRAAFIFRSMRTKPEVICVLSEIWCECKQVENMRLFNVERVKPLPLEKFEAVQSHIHAQINLFLRDTWITKLSNSIRYNLRNVGKGAYNINETCWDIYKFSKLPKLLAVVHYNMQDSLRFLVQDSLAILTKVVMDACHSVLTCPQDLVWGNNLITSPYMPKKNPLFLVDLVLNKTGVHYSTPLENFSTSMVNLFDKAIISTRSVPLLDRFVLQNLFVGGEPLLESVHLEEPQVSELREKLRSVLIQATIPLRAYAAEYEKYVELHNLDIETYILTSHNAEGSSQELKKEVEQQLKEMEIIEQSLPSSLVIGPFLVRVDAVCKSLTKKRKSLATALLDHLALKLRMQIDKACEECNIIDRKLREKPHNVEELSEKREWMKQIPEQLESYKEHLDKTLSDYELLEEFFHCIPDNDFNKKWTAIAWPNKIINQMKAAATQHLEDEESFRKTQLTEQNNFEEHLNNLQLH